MYGRFEQAIKDDKDDDRREMPRLGESYVHPDHKPELFLGAFENADGMREGAERWLEEKGDGFRNEWKRDAEDIARMAQSLEISEEEAIRVLADFERAGRKCREEEASLRVGVMERVRNILTDNKKRVALAAFLSASNIVGCASRGWLDHHPEEKKQERILGHEEKGYLGRANSEALEKEVEYSYIYGIKGNGEIVAMDGPCQIGSDTGVGRASSECGRFVLAMADNPEVVRVVHAHTHPIRSLEKDSSVFSDAHMSAEDIRMVRNGEGFHVFPPSFADLANPGNVENMSDKVSDQGNKSAFEAKVIDGRGVWTYAADKDSPAVEPLLKASEAFLEKIRRKKQEVGFSDADEAELSSLFDPVSGMKVFSESTSEKVKQVVQEMFSAQQAMEKEVAGRKDYLRFATEYESRQLELAAERFESREEFEEAVDDFIRWAGEYGIYLKYEPLK
jgi:plasmid stabilization system protein ParE